MDSLISRIHARILDGRPCDFPDEWLPVQPPIGFEVLTDAEGQLGFALPDLLRRLYTEVGNGGFGPGFGLLPISADSLGANRPVEAEFDLVSESRSLHVRNPIGVGWRKGMVPVFFCGCNIFECVDCLTTGGPIVPLDFDTEFGVLSGLPSLAARLEAWLIGASAW